MIAAPFENQGHYRKEHLQIEQFLATLENVHNWFLKSSFSINNQQNKKEIDLI